MSIDKRIKASCLSLMFGLSAVNYFFKLLKDVFYKDDKIIDADTFKIYNEIKDSEELKWSRQNKGVSYNITLLDGSTISIITY